MGLTLEEARLLPRLLRGEAYDEEERRAYSQHRARQHAFAIMGPLAPSPLGYSVCGFSLVR